MYEVTKRVTTNKIMTAQPVTNLCEPVLLQLLDFVQRLSGLALLLFANNES